MPNQQKEIVTLSHPDTVTDYITHTYTSENVISPILPNQTLKSTKVTMHSYYTITDTLETNRTQIDPKVTNTEEIVTTDKETKLILKFDYLTKIIKDFKFLNVRLTDFTILKQMKN